MQPQDAIDLTQEACLLALKLAGPLLLVALATGLVVGLLQAMTQVQEQTVSFVPRLVLVALALSVALPWLVATMVEYSRDLIANIPGTL